MLSLLDIAEKMQKGPKTDENVWNMSLFKKMIELTQRYQLHYSKDYPVFNLDDELADRYFLAAIDFLTEKGVYCISTGRVLQFTREEVLSAIKAMPKQITVGEGKDARVIKQSRLGEKDSLNYCPGHHAPFTEELAPLVVKDFASLPGVDYIEGFNFPTVDGREIYGLPMEVYASRREAAWMRHGVTKAGRPGLAIAFYPISTRAAALIAPIDREAGLRPSDGILLSVLPDIKVDQDYLAAAMVWEEYGGFKINGTGGQMGGFAGDVNGAIIEGIVVVLTSWLVYRDVFTANYIMSQPAQAYKNGRPSTWDISMIWASSVWSQALHRNTNHILFTPSGVPSGPGCEVQLLELALRAITHPINGTNIHITRQVRAVMNASQSPLDALWTYEVAYAMMRSNYTRETASDLALKIIDRLKDKLIDAPYSDIKDFYDLVHNKPLPQYEKIYLKVKDDLSALGLKFA
jgi:methylamine---corrinoid protein Co-methyltransferase